MVWSEAEEWEDVSCDVVKPRCDRNWIGVAGFEAEVWYVLGWCGMYRAEAEKWIGLK